MGLERINTYNKQVLLKVDGQTVAVSPVELQPRNEAETKTLLESRLGKSFPFPIFFHKNRDGSVAIATGEHPEVWPEDEK